MPLISIITPAYNASKFIAQTIKCVLEQTYTNWEMIIVDDGSTDETALEIKPFLVDKRIKYFYQENGKQSKARNHALHYAKGEYIAFLDADDLWVANKLEIQIKVLEENNVDLVYSQGYVFTDSFENTTLVNTTVGRSTNNFLGQLITANRIPILSVLLKSEKLKEVGNFNEHPKIQNAEDFHLWMTLADNGCTFYGMKERLFYYRRYANQSSNDLIMSVQCEVWAISIINFKNFDRNQKIEIMKTRINRAFMLNISVLSNEKFNKILSLYKSPLSLYTQFYLLITVSFFGKKLFEKIGYKFLKLNLKFNPKYI
jgi:glycosyltransferase involved in cell wall biosynthesis